MPAATSPAHRSSAAPGRPPKAHGRAWTRSTPSLPGRPRYRAGARRSKRSSGSRASATGRPGIGRSASAASRRPTSSSRLGQRTASIATSTCGSEHTAHAPVRPGDDAVEAGEVCLIFRAAYNHGYRGRQSGSERLAQDAGDRARMGNLAGERELPLKFPVALTINRRESTWSRLGTPNKTVIKEMNAWALRSTPTSRRLTPRGT
jgi:hypothetical protein